MNFHIPKDSILEGRVRAVDPTLDLEAEIHRLRGERNAVILAHYYQDPEIQDIADFVGDSLDLARKASATDADVIAFCGVKFMAEGAKILSRSKPRSPKAIARKPGKLSWPCLRRSTAMTWKRLLPCIPRKPRWLRPVFQSRAMAVMWCA